MADSKLNQFVASGTAADMAGFTPTPPTPASGPDPGYFFYQTDTGATYSWNEGGTAWVQVTGAGGLIGVQTITATGAGTYTPTTGTNSVIVEGVGGGGGGGGCVQPTGTSIAIAQGGGGGGWFRVRLTADFSGASYVVGAKGTGGTSGNNAGTAGSDTTFTDTAGSPTTYTAGGGSGGSGAGAASSPNVGAQTAGGTVTNGDIQKPGTAALSGIAQSANNIMQATGGSSMYGTGGTGVRWNAANTSNAGVNATGKGGGGSGAGAGGTGAAQAGGDGSDGVIIIWEYA